MTQKSLTINDIYLVQSYIDEHIVAEKIEAEDYNIYVAYMDDDDESVPVLVDGHHRLRAALAQGVEPIIHITDCDITNNLEEYVIMFKDLNNPEKLDGTTLW